ncbi:MAG: glycoside hydrolase family 127 protein [Phycisphaeraceae bacterium]|nr:glycoside hydrolase family 127 protein [Phycisphaeraceae bacterium]
MVRAMAASVVICGATAGAVAQDSGYRLRAAPASAVTLTDGFWRDRLERTSDETIWACIEQCAQTGRLANFARAAGIEKGPHEGYFFNDSDVYKVIEGASRLLQIRPDAKLRAEVDRIVRLIGAAQQDDGYLNTYYTLAEPGGRWTNLKDMHELYCAGHLFEAACAHFEATGERSLLDVAIRFADHIDSVFGPDRLEEPPGHEEIEIGLVRLAQVTGEARYVRLAEFFLDLRGRDDRDLRGEYQQDHLPVIHQREAVGHAVRACYLYGGMADVGVATGRRDLLAPLDDLWADVVGRKMYVTGGVGANRAGEAFGGPYELPNESAYAETCAAIGLALWADRMNRLHADGSYADIVERVMFNGFLVGVSQDGRGFFYPNPLRCDGLTPFNHGSAERSPWFACACCPSNDVRFLPEILGFMYATGDDGTIVVNQFAASEATIDAGLGPVRLRQTTEYPWDGRVRVELTPRAPRDFAVRLRVPGWARGDGFAGGLYRFADEGEEGVRLTLNGDLVEAPIDCGYAEIRRMWRPGDTLELVLPMPARRVVARSEVEACRGCVAIERGPIVYCIEGVDHDGRALNIALPGDSSLTATRRPDLLGGVSVIRGPGIARKREGGAILDQRVELTAIPYFAWNNRGPGEMAIWIPASVDAVSAPPASTIASCAVPSASHTWSADSVRAINDQKVPRSSGDHSIPRHTWWPHRGSREWAQLSFETPTSVSAVSVYWFDDSGAGYCRVPGAWRLLGLRDGQWRAIDANYPVARDAPCDARFDSIIVDALRVEVDLQEGYSGGILEWEVLP